MTNRFRKFTRPPGAHRLISAALALLLIWVPVMIAGEFQTVKNARYPEYSEDGVLETMVYAQVTKVPKDLKAKHAYIEGLKIDLYKNNEIDTTIKTESCTYERDKRFARGKKSVSIQTSSMSVTGTEFAYDGKRDRFVIFSDVRVELKQTGAFNLREAEAPASSAKTTRPTSATPATPATQPTPTLTAPVENQPRPANVPLRPRFEP